MTRVAVVTGASRGLGMAIAVRLAQEGADVIGIARDDVGLATLGEEIAALGRTFLPVPADLTEPNELQAAAERAWQWRGRIEILVNAAGVLVRKPEAALDVREWDLTFALNVRAPFLLMEYLGRRMYESAGGAIVNVASVAGERVTGAPAPYQASKAALVQLTRFYANRLAPLVRVNAVGPGYVRTALSREWLTVPENEEWVISHTPLGRVAEPGDITGSVAFLASNQANYVTGQHLLVDGGWSIR